MELPIDQLYEHERKEIESSEIEWRNFDEKKLYSDREYTGFNNIHKDRKGEKWIDQAIVGDSDEEYIFMSRSVDDRLECEADSIQILYAEEKRF
jgi:hypothetical protein